MSDVSILITIAACLEELQRDPQVIPSVRELARASGLKSGELRRLLTETDFQATPEEVEPLKKWFAKISSTPRTLDMTVRLIDEEGEELGTMTWRDAIGVAENRDLVLTPKDWSPPATMQLTDFNKMKYTNNKRRRLSENSGAGPKTKELRIRESITDHDFEIKMESALKMLFHGDQVLLIVHLADTKTVSAAARKLYKRLVEYTKQVADCGECETDGDEISALFWPR